MPSLSWWNLRGSLRKHDEFDTKERGAWRCLIDARRAPLPRRAGCWVLSGELICYLSSHQQHLTLYARRSAAALWTLSAVSEMTAKANEVRTSLLKEREIWTQWRLPHSGPHPLRRLSCRWTAVVLSVSGGGARKLHLVESGVQQQQQPEGSNRCHRQVDTLSQSHAMKPPVFHCNLAPLAAE